MPAAKEFRPVFEEWSLRWRPRIELSLPVSKMTMEMKRAVNWFATRNIRNVFYAPSSSFSGRYHLHMVAVQWMNSLCLQTLIWGLQVWLKSSRKVRWNKKLAEQCGISRPILASVGLTSHISPAIHEINYPFCFFSMIRKLEKRLGWALFCLFRHLPSRSIGSSNKWRRFFDVEFNWTGFYQNLFLTDITTIIINTICHLLSIFSTP